MNLEESKSAPTSAQVAQTPADLLKNIELTQFCQSLVELQVSDQLLAICLRFERRLMSLEREVQRVLGEPDRRISSQQASSVSFNVSPIPSNSASSRSTPDLSMSFNLSATSSDTQDVQDLDQPILEKVEPKGGPQA